MWLRVETCACCAAPLCQVVETIQAFAAPPSGGTPGVPIGAQPWIDRLNWTYWPSPCPSSTRWRRTSSSWTARRRCCTPRTASGRRTPGASRSRRGRRRDGVAHRAGGEGGQDEHGGFRHGAPPSRDAAVHRTSITVTSSWHTIGQPRDEMAAACHRSGRCSLPCQVTNSGHGRAHIRAMGASRLTADDILRVFARGAPVSDRRPAGRREMPPGRVKNTVNTTRSRPKVEVSTSALYVSMSPEQSLSRGPLA